ncbi:DEHA2B13838p [Debaryomyces hansenii CBS767]|uniref:DEHA2B13838p n=1 Tax=Debaryomyces hansenii (strain ATCC 36239 / CBS 767 / BCRC 21394 / JCM 1990 / NBRC 0083 / IGC 2968) TaxID=284592 RepID=Q6BW71_DEBHA|nr:DEHA2B13838p [Debaryomyces hansenii CBS767]CAG85558.2 DEHA2B13838p [Debaryomyces hansenii CBS767]|eukprot:XP_457548.2 DEHA2B13838p [Debaryomyces hansenii CBS767]
MKIFVSSQNVPIGYTVPPFPSLYWPLGPTSSDFQSSYLYYSFDIWKFTVFWSLILFGGFYLTAGLLAVFNQISNNYRHKISNPISKGTILGCIVLVSMYLLLGLAQGFICGAIIGLLLSAIYKAGSLNMSTWIPFCWGIAEILFNVCCSYSTSSVIL